MMAVQNQLAPTGGKQTNAVTFTANGNEITLNGGIVRKYLVNGDADRVTDQELMLFIKLCEHQGLDPFLKEAYIIKYGSSPAQIITGKSALEKRAARCERYRGFEAGIIVRRPQDGHLEWRTGTFFLPEEQLVGGWARVYVEGYTHPVETAVSMQEYVGRKRDGSINSQWQTKPATMIRKVAKAQALREAFPEDLRGMYSAEEGGMTFGDPTEAPIYTDAEVYSEPAPQAPDEAPPSQGSWYPGETDEFAAIMGGN